MDFSYFFLLCLILSAKALIAFIKTLPAIIREIGRIYEITVLYRKDK